MLSPYSSNGLMNVVYIVSSDFLSSLNFSFLIILIARISHFKVFKVNNWYNFSQMRDNWYQIFTNVKNWYQIL